MPSGPVEAKVRVIYGDTDKMGVVYYANYLRYFELSRGELFRALGGSYVELERQGFGLPVVEAHVFYRASARYDDLLVVKASISELRRASLAFEYEVRREGDEQVLCTGSTLHACLGADGRPTRLPEGMLQLLEGA